MSVPPGRYLLRLLGDPSTPDGDLMGAWIYAQLENLFNFGVERYAAEGSGIVVMDTVAQLGKEIRPGDRFTMVYVPIAQMEEGIGVWSSPIGLDGLDRVRAYRPPAEVILMVLYRGQLQGPYLLTRLIDPMKN